MHVDEHTLELLALGDPGTVKREAEIRSHLAECKACSESFAEIVGYYNEVEAEAKQSAAHVPTNTTRSLARKRSELEPYFSAPGAEVTSYQEVRLPSTWVRMGRFGQEHPVVSSFLGLALLGILAFSLTILRSRAESPAYDYYNTARNRLEIYDRSNKLLWSLPADNISHDEKYARNYNAHSTAIIDLHGDGKDEVVTSVALRGDGNSSGLKVYDETGRLLRRLSFEDNEIAFRGVRYYSFFSPTFLISERMPGGPANLFVYASNGRSPSFLARLDGNLNIVGKYWHYGNFTPYTIRPAHDGAREILITGSDDMNDMSGKNFEFVAVLDPTKIVGNKECAETPGFGFPASDAELYYIKLPKSSVQIAKGLGPFTALISGGADSLIRIQVASGSTNMVQGYWAFEFIFSARDMRVLGVKFTAPTPETFAMLKKEGKVHGTFNEQYLENLKNGVRYWDGKEWVKTPTMIKRPELASASTGKQR